MSLIELPKPDQSVLARRDEIVKDLGKLVPEALLIADAQGRRTY